MQNIVFIAVSQVLLIAFQAAFDMLRKRKRKKERKKEGR